MFNLFLYYMWICCISIASICDAIRRAISKVWFLCSNNWHSLKGYNSSKEIQFMEGCKAELTKIPKHLSVVVGSERVSSQILSKIAVYALIADIDYISFYDTREEFSLDDVKIPQYISSHKVRNGRFIWSMPNDKRKSRLLKYKNGMEKSIEISNLSYKEGKPLLAEICRDIFEKKDKPEIQGALKDKHCLSEIIGDTLRQKLNNLPDVELAIIFDKYMCTFGLLPWNTGFTEFHLIENGKCFSVQEFVDILYKFAKCEQRFGK